MLDRADSHTTTPLDAVVLRFRVESHTPRRVPGRAADGVWDITKPLRDVQRSASNKTKKRKRTKKMPFEAASAAASSVAPSADTAGVTCTECGRGFPSKNQLFRHVRAAHGGSGSGSGNVNGNCSASSVPEPSDGAAPSAIPPRSPPPSLHTKQDILNIACNALQIIYIKLPFYSVFLTCAKVPPNRVSWLRWFLVTALFSGLGFTIQFSIHVQNVLGVFLIENRRFED